MAVYRSGMVRHARAHQDTMVSIVNSLDVSHRTYRSIPLIVSAPPTGLAMCANIVPVALRGQSSTTPRAVVVAFPHCAIPHAQEHPSPNRFRMEPVAIARAVYAATLEKCQMIYQRVSVTPMHHSLHPMRHIHSGVDRTVILEYTTTRSQFIACVHLELVETSASHYLPPQDPLPRPCHPRE